MESSRHLEPASGLLAYRHGRSRLPRQGATWRTRSRLGLGQHGQGGKGLSKSLPAIGCLANELCARRGFDISAHGNLPSGGTILSVEDLNFDRSLVLLSLFNDARVYSDRAFEAPEAYVNALSQRVLGRIANSPALESIVDDLAHERVVIMSAKHGVEIQQTRSLSTPIHRVRIELEAAGVVRVLIGASSLPAGLPCHRAA